MPEQLIWINCIDELSWFKWWIDYSENWTYPFELNDFCASKNDGSVYKHKNSFGIIQIILVLSKISILIYGKNGFISFLAHFFVPLPFFNRKTESILEILGFTRKFSRKTQNLQKYLRKTENRQIFKQIEIT